MSGHLSTLGSNGKINLIWLGVIDQGSIILNILNVTVWVFQMMMNLLSSFGLHQISIVAAVLLLDIYPDTSKNQLYIPHTVICKNSNSVQVSAQVTLPWIPFLLVCPLDPFVQQVPKRKNKCS